ncbi:MAG TPA: murein biosynthesis integral membrane protein MurJ [Thermomicrobiales bacterium]|nr:murein biosynthesis integral membrane protein MurJ [Thermomicrobiales bacterium]
MIETVQDDAERRAGLDETAHGPRPTAHAAHTASRRIASAAFIIMVGNLLSRLFGLGREQVASYYFGTGDAIAPFALADSMLTILYDLLISGMVAAALVPVLSEYSAPERREELRRIVGTLLTLALIVIGGAVVVLEIFAGRLVRLWLSTGGSGALRADLIPAAVYNIRLILPAVVMLGCSAIFMATNYALGRFAWPSAAQAARNLAIIVATIALERWLGVSSMVVGVLTGALLLVLLQSPGLRDVLPRPALDLRHPAVRRIFILYAPIFIGLFANTFGQLVDRNFAWRAGEDALGAMRYATTLQQLVLGLVATGISLGALPALSRHAEAGDEAGFRDTLAAALRLTTVLIAPATFGLLALAWPLIALIFYHGATTATGAHMILVALLWYLPGTFFSAYDQLLIFVFYARKNTLTPQLVGVTAVVAYLAVEITLVGRFGMVALVAANSVQWTLHAAIMFYLARHLLGPDGRRALARTLAICLGAGVPMALLAFALSRGLEGAVPGPRLVRESAALFLPAAAGAAFYAWAVTRLGVHEFASLTRAVRRRVGLA